MYGPLEYSCQLQLEQLLDCFTPDKVRKPSGSGQLLGICLWDLLSQKGQRPVRRWTVGSGSTSEQVCGQQQISFV